MPFQLRNLFVVTLLHNEVLLPVDLWQIFRDAMSEDFVPVGNRGNIQPMHHHLAQRHIQTLLAAEQKTLQR